MVGESRCDWLGARIYKLFKKNHYFDLYFGSKDNIAQK